MEGEKRKGIFQRTEQGKKSNGREVTQFLSHLMSEALEP